MRGIYGRLSRHLFATLDRDESCWKTSAGILSLGLPPLPLTLPPAGMTVGGSLWELTRWERHTDANGFSSSPIPLLPTPLAREHRELDLSKDPAPHRPDRTDSLPRVAFRRPTLDGYRPALDRWAVVAGRAHPPLRIGNRLQPRFYEWLMGLPEGYVTDAVSDRGAIRLLGNGVCPQQAAAALAVLDDGLPPL